MLFRKLLKLSLPCVGLTLFVLTGCEKKPEADTGEVVVDTGSALSSSDKEAFPASSEQASVSDEPNQKFLSEKTIETNFGRVVIKEVDIENPSHASPGELNVYYAGAKAGKSYVRKAFPSAVQIGSWGSMSRWSVSNNLTGRPLIYAEGGGTWQGYTCGSAVLVELRPEGPVEIGVIPLHYDNSGAVDEGDAISWEGRVTNIVQGKSFDVSYTGSVTVIQKDVRADDQYRLQSKSPLLDGC